MLKPRFTDSQILEVLKEVEGGRQVMEDHCGLTWKTSSASINAISTKAGLTQVAMAPLLWSPQPEKSLISISIDGNDTAGVYSNCR